MQFARTKQRTQAANCNQVQHLTTRASVCTSNYFFDNDLGDGIFRTHHTPSTLLIMQSKLLLVKYIKKTGCWFTRTKQSHKSSNGCEISLIWTSVTVFGASVAVQRRIFSFYTTWPFRYILWLIKYVPDGKVVQKRIFFCWLVRWFVVTKDP